MTITEDKLQNELSEDSMMAFVGTYMKGILQPFADNVEEIHRTVIGLAGNIHDIDSRTEKNTSQIAEHVLFHTGLRIDLDHEVERANVRERRLEAAVTASGTAWDADAQDTNLKISKLDEWMQVQVDEIRQNVDRNYRLLTGYQKAEKEKQGAAHGFVSYLDRLKQGNESLEAAQKLILERLHCMDSASDMQKSLNQSLVREQKEQRAKMEIFHEHSESWFSRFDKWNSDMKDHLVRNRTEFHKLNESTKKFSQDSLDEQQGLFESVQKRLNKIDYGLANSQARSAEQDKAMAALEERTSLNLRDALRSLEASLVKTDQQVSEQEVTVQRLHGIVYGHPTISDGKTHLQELREDVSFGFKRTERMEKVLGIEPMTKDNQDLEAGLTFKGGILLTDLQIEDFKECFNRFDRDGSGTVGTAELGDVLESMGHNVPREVVLHLVDDIDKDRSGEICLDEFCMLMTKMLGPDGKVDIDDMMKRISETASREAMQQKIFEIVPLHAEQLQAQKELLEEEQTKLIDAEERVQNLEQNHLQFVAEMRKLRQCIEVQDDCWKGLSRGLKETHRIVHHPDEMLPSAMRLRSSLPPLSVPSPRAERPSTALGIGREFNLVSAGKGNPGYHSERHTP
jgi:Ca2+-binding EF-hand superfamily protein